VIYEITHLTTYEYGAAVDGAQCKVHLAPRPLPGQVVHATSLTLDPQPVERTCFTDFFGNRAEMLRFDTPHARLVLQARSTVEVVPPSLPPAGHTPSWERVGESALGSRNLGPDSPVHHLFASPSVALAAGAAAYGRPSFPSGRPVLAGAMELVGRIHREFAFDPQATNVSTPIEAVLATGRGVCQDFAHLMIAALRGLGLPAAYVSGYLRTVPPPGQERLAGADASHAWVALWCGPEIGWVGLDPTNGVAAGEDHVVLAIGRDYADVAPVSGIVMSAADQELSVHVDVVPLASERALTA
jgi:transglutaminase-like putative cysteine protease